MISRWLVLGICSVCAPATWAQSSATLYGIVDTGFTFNSNAGGARQYAMTSGNMSGNRWGLKGNEELGGGMSAIYTIEGGFSGATGAIGQNGTLFGRQVFVGLSSKSGTLTFGRQYSTASDFVGGFESGLVWAAGGAGYGAHPADVDNLDSFNRVNNAVKFQSVDYNGLSFGGMYSFGGKAGSIAQNQIWAVAASYAHGPFKAAAGYLSARSPNYSLWGDKTNDSLTGSNMKSPVIAGYATAAAQDVFAAGGSYALGPATLSFVYSNTRFLGLGGVAVAGMTSSQNAYSGVAVFNSYEGNVKYDVTPTLSLGASYAYTRNSGNNGSEGASYNQVNLGADYLLSKRTDLYALVVYQKVSGVDSTGNKAVAAIAGATQSNNDRQTVALVGIRHKF
ncbi:outer membrane porin OpcP [Burkholderia lata]|uniref:Outer membrane porin OpcP n=1 Tax=Burkholderia lata (strain ATCC 17760 / DSM 23089 / LMG 22485 / NCIMB 9086 / R18194 / 383) TaxID=482957 RepID=A0A6P2UI30_BURL3|nr:porin [Burkholderia lata]VWC76466.1 outer membrane porin OpcP [Burkholderia lata]